MLRDWLITLIIAGIAALGAPTDPATWYGRAGVWVRRGGIFMVAASLICIAALAVEHPDLLMP